MIKKTLQKLFTLRFLNVEGTSGVILIIATILALIIANSQNYQIYQSFFTIKIPIKLDIIGINKNLSLLDWINDFLMAIFFFLIGLELKKELIIGELANFRRAILPVISAIGGVLLPAIIFYYFNHNHPENLKGIAIPTATDIAFAFAIICLLVYPVSKLLRIASVSVTRIRSLSFIFTG